MESGLLCQPVSATAVAILVLLAVLVIYYFACRPGRRREGFVTQRAHEVYAGSKEVFGQKQDATYSEFKTRVPGADAVLYTDMRSLWKAGNMSPESVQKTL
jgi:hypothetical protein